MYDSLIKKIAREFDADYKKLKNHADKGNIYTVETGAYEYIRFRKKIEGIEKGTIIIIPDFEVIRGFPKIRRVLMLDSGLKNKFDSEFYVEEKMDGYNIRVAQFNNSIVAVTRGGLICPYTALRVCEQLCNHEFFKDYPNYMLCGEVVGLQNPYQEKSYPEAEDFKFFVFDIRHKKTGEYLPVDEKLNLVKKYRLPSVKNYGIFTADSSEKILGIVRNLGNESREGIVLKSPDMETVFKYTANQSTNKDLEYAFKFMFDYGQPFMFRRLVRQAFQAYELGLSKKELEKEAKRIGESILYPMIETIKEVSKGNEVTEDFEITVPSVEFGDYFVDHLNHLGAKATVREVKETKDGVIFKLSRHYQSTNDKVKAYLDGEYSSD